MKMTIEQAIERFDQLTNICKKTDMLTEPQEEYEQLADWLRELQEYRKQYSLKEKDECEIEQFKEATQ